MKSLVGFDTVQQVVKEADKTIDSLNKEGEMEMSILPSKPSVDNIKTDLREETSEKDEDKVDSSAANDSTIGKENQPIEGSDRKLDIAASQVSEVAQESETGFTGFDLNEVCSEEMGQPMDNIDLNVAEDSKDKIISGEEEEEESCVEASPSRSMRLNLDLNSLGDGSVDNVVQTQSSSSSSLQPSKRNMNLDLNLNSNNQNNASNNPGASREESVISLFGTPVEVKHQQPNETILEPKLELSLGGSKGGSMAAVYGPPPGGFGFPSGPFMYFSTPYGPGPFIIDPRGVPVAPQFLGSTSTRPPVFTQPPLPFFMNMAPGPSFGPNGVRPLPHNSALMMNGGLQGSNQGSNQWLQGSVVGGKRIEPDDGCDGFPVNYKHQRPPWK